MFDIFRLLDIFYRGGGLSKQNLSFIKKISFIHLFRFIPYPHLSYFCVLVILYIIVKDIGCLCKYIQPKQYTPTFKKPVMSSSADHTSSASNSTGTSILSQVDNKDITTNQKNNNTSNIDDIHSCVTPQKQNYSVQTTSTTTCLTPLNTTLPIAPVELHKTKQLPRLVKNIYVSILTEDLLMLPSVSNHGY